MLSQLCLCFLQPVWPGISKNSITRFRQRYWKRNWHNWDEMWGWFCILNAWISLGLFIFPQQHIITTKNPRYCCIKVGLVFLLQLSLIFFLGNFTEIQTNGKETPENILSSSNMYGWDDLLSNTVNNCQVLGKVEWISLHAACFKKLLYNLNKISHRRDSLAAKEGRQALPQTFDIEGMTGGRTKGQTIQHLLFLLQL